MGLLQDLLKEVPLSAVMKERVNLAEKELELAEREISQLKQRVEDLEKENHSLKKMVPAASSDDIKEDERKLLVLLFRNAVPDDQYDPRYPQSASANEERQLAASLGVEHSVLKYHLDRLEKLDLAIGTYYSGGADWYLTDKGRAYVFENELHKN